jgi:predicted NBD/HSP70 family sugar kinase
MREENVALVLRQVPPTGASRAQLAAVTGLTKSSVSGIVRDLLAAGLLREGGQLRGGVPGRPGTVVRLDSDHFAGLGLAFGVGTISACVVDLGHRVRVRHVRDLDNRRQTPIQTFAAIGELAAEALAGARDLGLTVVGSALAAPGPVDDVRGVLRHAPNLGWSDVGIRELLIECLTSHDISCGSIGSTHELPAVENEAHLAALGELWFGQGKRLGDYVGVFGDIGIGGAIVVDGDVFRGSTGLAGELGHTVVDPEGEPCGCGGRGCLETVAGLAAIARRAGIPDGSAGGGREPLAALRRALADGQPRALAAAANAGGTLGRALSSVIDVVDPQAVVIGGSLSTLEPWLSESVRTEVETHAMPRARTPPEIVWSGLGSAAAVLGAAGLVVARALSDPGPLLLPSLAT